MEWLEQQSGIDIYTRYKENKMIVRQNKFTGKEFEELLTVYQINFDVVSKQDILERIPGGHELVEKALRNVDEILDKLK